MIFLNVIMPFISLYLKKLFLALALNEATQINKFRTIICIENLWEETEFGSVFKIVAYESSAVRRMVSDNNLMVKVKSISKYPWLSNS